MRKFFNILSTMLLVGGIAACSASVGHNFDMQAANHLTPGVTTYEQAVSLVGAPEGYENLPDGSMRVTWAYGHAAGVSGFVSSEGKKLVLLFDQKHVFQKIEKQAQR